LFFIRIAAAGPHLEFRVIRGLGTFAVVGTWEWTLAVSFNSLHSWISITWYFNIMWLYVCMVVCGRLLICLLVYISAFCCRFNLVWYKPSLTNILLRNKNPLIHFSIYIIYTNFKFIFTYFKNFYIYDFTNLIYTISQLHI
jgi:hypothetical protein